MRESTPFNKRTSELFTHHRRVDCSENRPNSNPVCGAVVEVQVERNSSEGEVEVPRVGAVERASRNVLNMACEMDGHYF